MVVEDSRRLRRLVESQRQPSHHPFTKRAPRSVKKFPEGSVAEKRTLFEKGAFQPKVHVFVGCSLLLVLGFLTTCACSLQKGMHRRHFVRTDALS
jgi:hypothetical protein